MTTDLSREQLEELKKKLEERRDVLRKQIRDELLKADAGTLFRTGWPGT